MLTWNNYEGTAGEWNSSLSQAQDRIIFQTYEWGQYKDSSKLKTRRYIAHDINGNLCGMCQFSVRRLPLGLHFIWSAGGPIFQFNGAKQENLSELLSTLFKKIHEEYSSALIRVHSHVSNTPNLAFKFNQAATRPIFKLNTGFTIKFDVQEIPDFRKNMTSKHRYYTKKSSDSNIQWIVGNRDIDLNYLATIHQEMVKNKNIASLAIGLDELILMRNFLQGNLFVLTGTIDGAPITACLILEFSGAVFYMIAATGNKGRQESAAYAMIEKLFMQLQEKNIQTFDFAGVDPITKGAAGVNHFKMGFGGELVEHLGEWESASNEFVRVAINFAIRLKGGRA